MLIVCVWPVFIVIIFEDGSRYTNTVPINLPNNLDANERFKKIDVNSGPILEKKSPSWDRACFYDWQIENYEGFITSCTKEN